MNDKGAWATLDYANKFEHFWKFDDNVKRIDVRDVSCDEFIERYEKPYLPVVIEGVQVSEMRMMNIFHESVSLF